ncbi:MAG: hypothetical protein NTX28_13265, partial [Novosphingobium sp.]|nr:hypothetical protein [Novosphingobium sp.]
MDTYAVGEVFNGDVRYVAPYQQYLSGTLSYPLFFVLRSVFGQHQVAPAQAAARSPAVGSLTGPVRPGRAE